MRIGLLFLVLFSSSLWSQTQFDQGVQLYNQARYDAAEIAFTSHLGTAPHHSKTREYLADIFAQRKQWQEAFQAYVKLSNAQPNHAELWYKKSGALAMWAKSESYWFQYSRRQEIKSGFLRVIQLNPQHINAHWALVEYGLAVPEWLGGGTEFAQLYAQKLQLLSAVDGYLAKGKIAQKQSDWKIAQINLEKAFEVGQSLHTFTTLKTFYLKRNLTQEAQKLTQRWALLSKL